MHAASADDVIQRVIVTRVLARCSNLKILLDLFSS